jgi:hypothetical protein
VVVVVVEGVVVVVVVTGTVVVVTGTVVVVAADTGTADHRVSAPAARTALVTARPIRPRREDGGSELGDPVIETLCAPTRHPPPLRARISAGGLTLIPAGTGAADDRSPRLERQVSTRP